MGERGPNLPLCCLDEEAVLRNLLEGTATATGRQFFAALARSLGKALGAQVAWITEYEPVDATLNALALVNGNELQTNYRYSLKGTPCEPVIRDARILHHPDNVADIYPEDRELKSLGVRSYLGVPLLDTDGTVLGHLAVMDQRPMPEQPEGLAVIQIFAARAAAELQRIRVEKDQQQIKRLLEMANEALTESEQQFRDLFEEAPMAYVHEDLDSRFIHANHTALQILGIKPEEVPHTYGKSLVPDTPEAQQRVQEALTALSTGKKTSGLILELRRKDNGEPIWIQWWSSPAPDGTYTRTMFIDITEQVLMSRENKLLEAQNVYLQEELKSAYMPSFIGESERMRQVYDDLSQVAPTDTTVLIFGETGTGKELAARAVHSSSTRRNKPLIKVNCAALPASLIEAELFGHEKGSFTGATRDRDGRFALADGGTIFLDEIGELPIELQAKLLRVLQEGEIERVGSSKTRTVNVRVIAATNRDLLTAIQNGEFREDLYYRLAVFPLELPPLRERGNDIIRIAEEFSVRFAQQIGKAIDPLTDGDADRLLAYSWPGNVRELQNVIERAVITSTNGMLNLNRALPESEAADEMEGHKQERSIHTMEELQAIERRNMVLALESTNWKVSGDAGAAVLLGVNPSTLNSRMKALGIKRPSQE